MMYEDAYLAEIPPTTLYRKFLTFLIDGVICKSDSSGKTSGREPVAPYVLAR